MKNLILIFLLTFTILSSQSYRTHYATQVHLSSNPEDGFEYIIVAPTGLTSSYTFSLPPTLGTNGEILMSLGDGSYTWTNPSVTNATPGGANSNIQFKLSDSFEGSNDLTWNNSSNKLHIGTLNGNFGVNVNGIAMSGYNGRSGSLNLHTGHAAGYKINFKPSSNMTSSATFTLPANDGTVGQFLITDGQGNLSWTSAAVGGNFDCIGQGTGGGSGNSATGDDSFIGGGNGNSINSTDNNSFIGGGSQNSITGSSDQAAIVVGENNEIGDNSDNSLIGAGSNNTILDGSINTVIGAGRYNTIAEDADNSVIGSGEYNWLGEKNSVIAVGHSNTISYDAEDDVIGAGAYNFLNYSQQCGIWTGYYNKIEGPNPPSSPWPNYSVIFAGANNRISEDYDFIGAGSNNYIDKDYSAIAGGYGNAIKEENSSVLGGYSNTVTGEYSMAFGYQSEADADYTVAIGRRAVADNSGAFVLADNTDAELNSSSTNRMEMRFKGGYRFYTNTALTTGMLLNSGESSWSGVSDRNSKSNILNLNYSEFFEKISELEISSWAYSFSENKGKRNYGPMAQDFYRLFGKDDLGEFGSEVEIIANHITNVGFASLKGLINEYENNQEKIKELEEKQSELLKELKDLKKEFITISYEIGEKK